jgi:hypothetical protein
VQKFGARPAHIAAVRRFAASHDLSFLAVHPDRRQRFNRMSFDTSTEV